MGKDSEICHGELVLSSLFVLCSPHIFLAITLNSKNSAGDQSNYLVEKGEETEIKANWWIGGF